MRWPHRGAHARAESPALRQRFPFRGKFRLLRLSSFPRHDSHTLSNFVASGGLIRDAEFCCSAPKRTIDETEPREGRSAFGWVEPPVRIDLRPRVIHFGTDECHRITVLRSVGYSVDDCSSLTQLRAQLSSDADALAVCITEDLAGPPEAAASVAKSCSSAPLVLFRRSNGDCEETAFDLIVETLTPPQKWLNEIEDLIARSQWGESQLR